MSDWQLIPADFDGDRNVDILVFRPSDGTFVKWYSPGYVGQDFNYQAARYIGGQPGVWPGAQMIPVDFNGNARAGVVVFRPSDGAFAKWYSDGGIGPDFNYQQVRYAGGQAGAWAGAKMIPVDFNGDGNVDILLFRPSDGGFVKGYSDGSVGPDFNYQAVRYIGGQAGAWTGAQMIPVDFNGDGKVDILVFRPSDGAFAKWYSDGSVGPEFNYQAVRYIGGHAGAWTGAQMIPVDFNGDGKVDILVFRPSDGAFAKWYSDGSVGPDFNYQAVRYIGGHAGAWTGAQMIPLDFNGDGKVDIVVFRPSDGAFAKWYSDGSVGPDFNYQAVRYIGGHAGTWTGAQMIPVDFNGDGKVDVLVFRPSDCAFAKWCSDGSVGPDFKYQPVGNINSPSGMWQPAGPYHVTGFVGPTPVGNAPVGPLGGRIDWIDFSPNFDGAGQPAIYLAMPGGGVFRSTDFTSPSPAWTPLTDHLPGLPDVRRVSLNVVSTLAVDPKHPRTIYARAGGSPPEILKSNDGGDTWTLIGQNQFGAAGGIWRVLVDPLGTVYLCFNSGGFWLSTDGGTTWINAASKVLDGVEFHDAVYFIDGNGQLLIFAGVIDRQGQNRSGIWSFVNGNWNHMAISLTNLRGEPFTAALINHITLSADHIGGVCASLSQAADDGKVGLLNIFKLVQGIWVPQWFSKSIWFGTQGGYVQGICIAPDGRIYAGSKGLAQSSGGTNFVEIPVDAKGIAIHTDVHAVAAYQGKIYVGTDGGLFRFTPRPNQPGVDAWESLNTPSLTNFLSTGAAAHPSNPAIVLVGSQDNGINRLVPGVGWAASSFSNEREKVRFDPDPGGGGKFAFSGDPNNGFYWSQDGGASFVGFQPQGVPAPDPPPPFAFHPKNSARIMIGWMAVFETPDRGQTWKQLLTLQAFATALAYVGDQAAYVAAPGQVFQTLNGGQNWSPLNFDFGGGIVSLCPDATNADAIYGATGSRIFRRLSPQAQWEELTGDLTLAINVMALLPQGGGIDPWLLAGTGSGVWIASKLQGNNTHWVRFGTGLPDASVLDLDFAPATGLLVTATWGRGAWTTVISSTQPCP